MKNKLLTVLPAAEQFALYGLPDFDDGQRLAFLSLSEQELALACSLPVSMPKPTAPYRSATSRPSMPSSISPGTMRWTTSLLS